MTFKELNSRLPTNISYKDEDAKIINNLKVDFRGISEIEYGFYLRNGSSSVNSAKVKFSKNVKGIIRKYKKLSKKDKYDSYIYIYYNKTDDVWLCLAMV